MLRRKVATRYMMQQHKKEFNILNQQPEKRVMLLAAETVFH